MLIEFIYSVLFSINALIRERGEMLRQLTCRKSNLNNSLVIPWYPWVLVPHISHEVSHLQTFMCCRCNAAVFAFDLYIFSSVNTL